MDFPAIVVREPRTLLLYRALRQPGTRLYHQVKMVIKILWINGPADVCREGTGRYTVTHSDVRMSAPTRQFAQYVFHVHEVAGTQRSIGNCITCCNNNRGL